MYILQISIQILKGTGRIYQKIHLLVRKSALCKKKGQKIWTTLSLLFFIKKQNGGALKSEVFMGKKKEQGNSKINV